MKEIQDIKRLLYPLVKRLPWVVLIFVLAVAFAWRATDYMTPVYEAKSIIRLDDHANGFSDNNLYEDLDIFSETNDVLTEVEMIKSDVILLAALERMPTNTEYFRVGKLRTSEIYTDTPFYVEIDSNHFEGYNQLIEVKIENTESYAVVIASDTLHSHFGDTIRHKGYHFSIQKTPYWIEDHGSQNFKGDYQFRVNTPDFLLSNFVSGNLFVKEVDKNVAVIQVHFEGENPQRVADFANAVASAYLNDHIESKMNAAKLTEQFLDDRTNETYARLKKAENALESYRLRNRVLNIRQETETDLRKIAQLDVQLVNLKMKMVAMDSLENSIAQNRTQFLEVAPSYEAYGGLLFTELVKKLKSYEAEKTDLLVKFTPNSQEVKTVEKKMKDVERYIIENIKNHKKNTAFQLQKIERDIEIAMQEMDDLPSREKKMVMLEREFKHQQDLFNFLKKKQMEAGIAKLAHLNFHRIIKEAKVATDPSRPNKSFNVGLAGFLSLLLSIAFVYVIEGIRSKINSRSQLESMTDATVLGAVKYDAAKSMDGSLDAVISNLLPIVDWQNGVRISFNSSISAEGKTYMAQEVAKALALTGRKVLLIDLNARNPQWKNLLKDESEHKTLETYFDKVEERSAVLSKAEVNNLTVCGFEGTSFPHRIYLAKDFEDQFDQLTNQFEVVIMDNPGYAITPEAKVYMSFSDYSVYVMRHNFTSTKYIKDVNAAVKALGVKKVGLVLNRVPQGVNHSGTFYGSRYMYNQPKGFVAHVKHYWDSYKNAWNI